MQTHRLVLPEDLNQYGYLFGGRLLSWIDEASWIAASLEFPEARLVTIGMDDVTFRHSVRQGTILSIESTLEKKGTTSLTYKVIVKKGRAEDGDHIFSTHITFVNLDENGEKQPIS